MFGPPQISQLELILPWNQFVLGRPDKHCIYFGILNAVLVVVPAQIDAQLFFHLRLHLPADLIHYPFNVQFLNQLGENYLLKVPEGRVQDDPLDLDSHFPALFKFLKFLSPKLLRQQFLIGLDKLRIKISQFFRRRSNVAN